MVRLAPLDVSDGGERERGTVLTCNKRKCVLCSEEDDTRRLEPPPYWPSNGEVHITDLNASYK